MTDTQAISHFLQGGWRVSDQHQATLIVLESYQGKHLFRLGIDLAADESTLLFSVQSDMSMFTSKLHEGSSAFVKAGRLQVSRAINSFGKSIAGRWEVVQEAPVEFIETRFTVFAGKGQSLVAAFQPEPNAQTGENDFVLDFFETDKCADGLLTLFVDGKAPNGPDGSTLKLLPGSSVIGRGRTIAVSVEGQCQEGLPFTGRLKIARQSPGPAVEVSEALR